MTSKRSTHGLVRKVTLALQGGGAHGAFTWGVLDRLLEEESLQIEGISGASAGAINASVMSYGLIKGGKKTARQLLEKFWRKVGHTANLSPFKPTVFDKMLGNNKMDFSPSFMALDFMTRMFSPSQLNIFDINPLKDILHELIDFPKLRAESPIKLFVNATHVLTGRSRVFQHGELTLEMLLASACLPFIFKTVEVNGEYYWDGGYSGNPVLSPLVSHCTSSDIIWVEVAPLVAEDIPVHASDIVERVNEISCNTALLYEMRSIAFVNKLIAEDSLKTSKYRPLYMHRMEAEDIIQTLGKSSKFNGDWDFLLYMKEIGRQTADDWLEKHYDALGMRATFDIEATLKE